MGGKKMEVKEDLIELLKTGDDDDLRSLRDNLLKIPEEERLGLDITEDRAGTKYMRCMIVKAGTLIVGATHKTEDSWEVLEGEIHVRELGQPYKLLKKGDKGLGVVGTFRIGVAETDVLWMNECDMPKWVKHGNEYKYLTNMTNWEMFLERWGFTEEEIQRHMDSREVHKTYIKQVYVGKSFIHGNGCFSEVFQHKGSWLGKAIIGEKYTMLGRYINHSSEPNVQFNFNSDDVSVIALKDIRPGEELTVDYNRNAEQLGVAECLSQQ